MDYYNALLAGHQSQELRQTIGIDGKTITESGSFEAEIVGVNIIGENGKATKVVTVGASITLQIDVRVNEDIDYLVLGCGIKDRLGQMVFGTNTWHTNQCIENVKAGESISFYVSFAANLGVGTYSVHCSLVRSNSHIEKNYHWLDRALVFEVINVNKPSFVGYAWSDMKFHIVRNGVILAR